MTIILKKLGKKQFVWDQNAFQKRGGWYETLKGGGYGRSATEKERSQLGIPIENEAPEDRGPNEDEQEDDRGEAGSYRHAANVRYTGLRGLVTANLLRGHNLKESVKSSVSDTLKAHATGLKEKFDPLNIARSLTGNLGATILGLATNRSDEDLNYFTGQRRRRRITSASSIGANAGLGSGRKVGNLDTAMYTSVPEGKQQRFRKGDGAADLLSRLLNLMKKYHEEDIRQYELDRNFAKTRKEEQTKWNKEILTTLGGAGAPGLGKKTNKEDDEGLLDYALTAAEIYAGSKVSGFILKKAAPLLRKNRFTRSILQGALKARRIPIRMLKQMRGSAKGVFTKPVVKPPAAIPTAAKIIPTSQKPVIPSSKKPSIQSSKRGGSRNQRKNAIAKMRARPAGVAASKIVTPPTVATPTAAKVTAPSGVGGVASAAGAAAKGAKYGSGGIIGKVITDAAKRSGGVGKVASKAIKASEGILGFLKRIPLLGSIVAAGFMMKDIQDAIELRKAGQIDDDELRHATIAAVGGAIGGIGGAEIGALIGGAAGTAVPVVGNILGAIAGGVGGGVLGSIYGPEMATALYDAFSEGKNIQPQISAESKPAAAPAAVATPMPSTPNVVSERAQKAITTNQSEKINSSASSLSKPITIDNSKTITKNSTARDRVSYGETFEVRKMDDTLAWVIEASTRRV